MTSVDVALAPLVDAQRSLIDEENPWPGLGAFDEEAQRFFNGRRKEAAELRRVVLYAPLTVVFGASGLGKTSLLQAGVFPLLRKENTLPVYVRLDVRDRTAPLIDQVKQAMLAQFQIHQVDAPDFRDSESLWEWLHREGLELWSARNQLLTPLFAFDQFEELFTLGAENLEAVAGFRRDFVDLTENRIPAAVSARFHASDIAGEDLSLDSQRYKVLVSFREDFLPAVESWKRDTPSIMRNRLRLLPMSGDQAFEAVHTTAPHLVDEAIAREIVRFVAAAQEDGPRISGETRNETDPVVEPALLSLVCHGLNQRRKSQGKASFDRALLQGTGQAIVSNYYQEAVADLPERAQRFVEQELITERGFRKQCDLDDARSVHGVSDRELRLLVDRRLLRIEPQQGTERVELTHDLLTGVVREYRDRRREQERVRRQRQRVAVVGLAGVLLVGLVVVFGLLYRGAEQQRRAAEEQRRVAEEQTHEAAEQRTIAFARQLAMRSRLVLDSPQVDMRLPDRPGESPSVVAALLATQAMRHLQRLDVTDPEVGLAIQRSLDLLDAPPAIAPIRSKRRISGIALNPDSGQLLIGIEDAAFVWQWPPVGDQPLAEVSHEFPTTGGLRPILEPKVTFLPDGRQFVTTGGGIVRIWSLDQGGPHLLKQLVHTTVVASTTAGFSRDSRYVATTGRFTVRVWDWRSDNPETNIALREDADDAAFSPDGHSLLIATRSGVLVRAWPLDDARPISRLDHGGERVRSLTFSPDGRLLATTGDTGVWLWAWPSSMDRPLAVLNPGTLVTDALFSRDGRYLATASADNLARVWDVKSGQELIRIHHARRIEGVAFDRDARYLITADESAVRAWSWLPANLITSACARLPRNLTVREWQQYLGAEPYAKTCDNLPIDRGYVDEGRRLASDGDIDGAIAIFRRANSLDSSLRLEPENEARRARVSGLQWKAMAAVRSGEFEAAQDFYRQAAALDPKVQIPSDPKMREARAELLVETFRDLTREGRFRDALEVLEEAQRLHPKVVVEADDWNELCWRGSLEGFATQVLSACQRAVALAPEDAGFRDSRGLARALTGDYRGAAEDFAYYVARAGRSQEEISKRDAWIKQLNTDQNPFDQETLKALGRRRQ